MKIVVYGSGCKNCKLLYSRVLKVVEDNNIEAEVVYETDFNVIAKKGFIQMPVVEVNDKVVIAGRIPKESDILSYIG